MSESDIIFTLQRYDYYKIYSISKVKVGRISDKNDK